MPDCSSRGMLHITSATSLGLLLVVSPSVERLLGIIRC